MKTRKCWNRSGQTNRVDSGVRDSLVYQSGKGRAHSDQIPFYGNVGNPKTTDFSLNSMNGREFPGHKLVHLDRLSHERNETFRIEAEYDPLRVKAHICSPLG